MGRSGPMVFGAAAVLAAAAFLAAAVPAGAQLAIADRHVRRDGGKLTLDIHYPRTGRAAIDRKLADYALGLARIDAKTLSYATRERPYSVTLTYKVMRNDPRIFSVLFQGDVFTGGAHGLPVVQSFNLRLPEGRELALGDLVAGPPALERISRLARAELTRRLSKDGATQFIQDGTAPKPESFAVFAWLPDALVVEFPPYQVAPYVYGTQSVTIPKTALAGVIRPDAPR